MKHPGYEKIFFCEEDLKGICERCLDLHEGQQHKVYTIALQARHSKKDFNSFKQDFSQSRDDWETHYQKLERIHIFIQKESDRVQDEIDSVFNEVERIINQQKVMMKAHY